MTSNKLLPEHGDAISKYFSGYDRIAAVPAIHFSGMGDRIEIYDLGSPNYVGAIYPDGAAMIWSILWFKGRKDLMDEEFFKHEPTYSSLMLKKRAYQNLSAAEKALAKKKKRKRVTLIEDDEVIPKRKVKVKRKRVSLNV